MRVHEHPQPSTSCSRATARGDGCEICKPAVASILASTWNEHDPRQAAPAAAGHQRPLPRQHPARRHLLGGAARPRRRDHARAADRARRRSRKKYGLYTKITGGQRIDLFGARLEQLPDDLARADRRRLRVRARLRQGAAHGEVAASAAPGAATACRTRSASPMRVENRYKGLRARTSSRARSSGCARECAEAQGKDFGIIATEKGYNLYVCGNGGHEAAARRSCSPPTSTRTTLIRYLDRFLMFYMRTADRLQRTASLAQQPRGRARLPAAGGRRRQARASAPSSRPRWRTSSTPTSASGRPRSRIRRSWRGSGPS